MKPLLHLLLILSIATAQEPSLVNSNGAQIDTDGERAAFREALGGVPARTDLPYLDVNKPPFNAVPDWNGVIGVSATGTNNRAALQAAIDAAYAGNIKTVRISGKYLISGGPLDIKGRDLVLEGNNRFSDFIYQHSADQHCLRFVDQLAGDPDVNLYQGLRRISLRGRGIGTATGTGIWMNDRSGATPLAYNGARWHFYQVDVRGFEIGLDVFFWDDWKVDQCLLLSNNINARFESFTNTVEIANTNLGSSGTRSLHLLSGASVVAKHLDLGNEPQAVKVESGASLYLQDGNFETFTGTAPTVKGVIEMATGSKLVVDNLYVTSAGSSLPAIYLTGGNECYIGTGGLYTTLASGVDIEDAGVSIITNASVPGYGSNGFTSAVKVVRTGKHAFNPGPFQVWQDNGALQLPTARAENRLNIVWTASNDVAGIHRPDRAWASVRGKDQTYTWEPILNRDLRIWDYIFVGGAADLVKNTRVRDNNEASLIEKFLPATSAAVAVDDTIDLMAVGAGGIRVKVQPLQAHQIRYGSSLTTSNTGYITLSQGASCRLVCTSASGGGYWLVTNATGTITVN